ncbi:TetR/AcrR family transcriptional regulator [Furfurilactobacillus cerevisiae]|uniref:TetR/AcrR family transcriptional regulator n=1 Tax=Furfurilactobacillus rossiae TaxID=231049 RepID=UPI003B985935
MEISNVETLFDKTLQESKLTAKQQSVLKVSLNLFAEKGFDGTSTSEIAKQAGVSEGTVFKQFKTKDGILAALLNPFLDQVVPMAATEFLAEIKDQRFDDLTAFFNYVIKDRMMFAIANQKQLKILIQEIIRNSDMIQSFVGKIVSRILNVFGGSLQTFKDRDALVDWPTERIIRYFLGVAGSYIVPAVLIGKADQLDIEKSCSEATEFLVRGLTPIK